MEYMHEYAKPFFFEGGEHAVLLTHGFTGSPATMRYLGEHLRDAGFTVQGICLPGHGTRMEDMRKATWQDYLKAETDAVHDLKKRYRYVTLCGLSMGGDLSLIAAAQNDVTACISVSSPMKAQAPFIWAAGAAALFVPTMYWKKDSEAKQDDPMRDYKVGYPGFPTRSVVDLHHLMGMAKRSLSTITCPLLVVQSRTDHTISRDSADIILTHAGSKHKEMLWLDHAPHACTAHKACDEIAACAISFLNRVQG